MNKKGWLVAATVTLVLAVGVGVFVATQVFTVGEEGVAAPEISGGLEQDAGLVWVIEPEFGFDSMGVFEPYGILEGTASRGMTYENSLHHLLDPAKVDASRLGWWTLFSQNGESGLIDYNGIRRQTSNNGYRWFLVERQDLASSETVESKVFPDVLYGEGYFVYVPAEHKYTEKVEEGLSPQYYNWLRDDLTVGGEVESRYFDDGLFDGFGWDTGTEQLLHFATSIHNGYYQGAVVNTEQILPAREIVYDWDNEYVLDGYGKYGFVRSGQVILPFEYDWVSYVNDGIAVVQKGDDLYYINMQGDTVGSVNYDYANQLEMEHAYREQAHEWFDSFESYAGHYGYLYGFSQGLCAVNQGGVFTYINTQGETVLPVQFEDALPVYNNMAWVKLDGLWGVLDMSAYTTS